MYQIVGFESDGVANCFFIYCIDENSIKITFAGSVMSSLTLLALKVPVEFGIIEVFGEFTDELNGR